MESVCICVCKGGFKGEWDQRNQHTQLFSKSFAVKGKRIREEVIGRESGVKAEEEFEYFGKKKKDN